MAQIFPAFLPFFQSTQRYNVLVGGRGSGKSSMAALYCVLRAARDGAHIIGMRDTMIRAKESVLKDWMIQLDRLSIPYDFQKSENKITLGNGATLKAYAFYESSGKPTEFKSLRPEPSIIWVEEAINLTQQQFTSINGMLRGQSKIKKRMIMTLNPDSKACFIYKEFESGGREALILHSTPEDNPYIRNDAEYLKQLDKINDPELRNAWRYGIWANLSGTVYRYETVEAMPEGLTPRYGVDFGYNDPMAVIEVSEADGTEGRVLYIRQVIYQSGMTNADLAERMKYNVPSIAEIYADTASPDGIETLRRAGFVHVFGARKGKDSVLDGIKKVKEYIIRVVDDGKQKGLIDELDKYRWKEDAAGQQTDVPVDANNHLLDALRYAVFREEVKPRQPIQVIDFNF